MKTFREDSRFKGSNVAYYTYDTIGSRQKTLKAHRELEAMGLKPCFVDHLADKKVEQATIEAIMDKDRWIAVGGFARGSNPSWKDRKRPHSLPLDEVKRRSETVFNLAEKYKTKVHGFGAIKMSLLKAFPFGA